MAGLWDELSKGLADAVKDIREKVVEEPMYGRPLHGPDVAPLWSEGRDGAAFGSLTQSREIKPAELDKGRDV